MLAERRSSENSCSASTRCEEQSQASRAVKSRDVLPSREAVIAGTQTRACSSRSPSGPSEPDSTRSGPATRSSAGRDSIRSDARGRRGAYDQGRDRRGGVDRRAAPSAAARPDGRDDRPDRERAARPRRRRRLDPLEFEALSVPFGDASAAFATRSRLPGLVRGEAPPETRYWQLPAVELLPRPKRSGGPPVWIGGSGPQALRNAGHHCDG